MNIFGSMLLEAIWVKERTSAELDFSKSILFAQ